MSFAKLARKIDLSVWAVQSILTDILGRSKVSSIWVLRMLTGDQKRTWLDISRYLLSCCENDRRYFVILS